MIISGSTDPDIQEKCLDRGASGYIAKPFERTPLLEQVQKTLVAEVQPSKVSEDIMSEVKLALMLLEREGLNTRDQTKEELNKVKSRLKKII